MTSEELKQRKRENAKRWKAAHPDRVREHNRQYHDRHRTERILYFRKYHQTMREKAKKYDELTKGEE